MAKPGQKLGVVPSPEKGNDSLSPRTPPNRIRRSGTPMLSTRSLSNLSTSSQASLRSSSAPASIARAKDGQADASKSTPQSAQKSAPAGAPRPPKKVKKQRLKKKVDKGKLHKGKKTKAGKGKRKSNSSPTSKKKSRPAIAKAPPSSTCKKPTSEAPTSVLALPGPAGETSTPAPGTQPAAAAPTAANPRLAPAAPVLPAQPVEPATTPGSSASPAKPGDVKPELAPTPAPARRRRSKSKDELVKMDSELIQPKEQVPPTPEQLRSSVMENLQRCNTADLEAIALLVAPDSLSTSQGVPSKAKELPPAPAAAKAKPAASAKPSQWQETGEPKLTAEEYEKKELLRKAAHARYMRFSRSLFRLEPSLKSLVD